MQNAEFGTETVTAHVTTAVLLNAIIVFNVLFGVNPAAIQNVQENMLCDRKTFALQLGLQKKQMEPKHVELYQIQKAVISAGLPIWKNTELCITALQIT